MSYWIHILLIRKTENKGNKQNKKLPPFEFRYRVEVRLYQVAIYMCFVRTIGKAALKLSKVADERELRSRESTERKGTAKKENEGWFLISSGENRGREPGGMSNTDR